MLVTSCSFLSSRLCARPSSRSCCCCCCCIPVQARPPSQPPATMPDSLARVFKHMSASMNGADEQGANQRVALYNLPPSGEAVNVAAARGCSGPTAKVSCQRPAELPWSNSFQMNGASSKWGSCSETIEFDSMIIIIVKTKTEEKSSPMMNDYHNCVPPAWKRETPHS